MPEPLSQVCECGHLDGFPFHHIGISGQACCEGCWNDNPDNLFHEFKAAVKRETGG